MSLHVYFVTCLFSSYSSIYGYIHGENELIHTQVNPYRSLFYTKVGGGGGQFRIFSSPNQGCGRELENPK